MKAKALAERADSQELAAVAVQCLVELADRFREKRDYEMIAFVRDGVKAVETLLIPDRECLQGRRAYTRRRTPAEIAEQRDLVAA